jgi:hypothetical protein
MQAWVRSLFLRGDAEARIKGFCALMIGNLVIELQKKRPSLKQLQSLSHTTWDCKYHMISIPNDKEDRRFISIRKGLSIIGSLFLIYAKQQYISSLKT